MEEWDLYTCERIKTGRTVVKGSEIPKGYFRLVIHVCVFNKKGELLIQKRQITKSGWPDLWDLSVGGHVIAGETSQQAAERELKEELGIGFSFQGLRPAVSPSFPNGFDDMYTILMDLNPEELILQEEEVQQEGWADRKRVCEMIDEGVFIPYHKSLIELLFFLKDHPEAHTA